MNQFIIATHSTLAEGFANVVRFFKADLENVQYINAYVKDAEFEKSFRECLERVKGEPVLVLTDIMGGSVNQVAARLMPEYGYQLITGINLPLLLELVFIEDPITPEQIDEILVRCRQELTRIELAPGEMEEDSEEL